MILSTIYWIFISFGTFMGILCIFHGVRKIVKGDISFRLRKLIRNMTEFEKVSADDFSGSELLILGVIQIFCAIIFFRMNSGIFWQIIH